MEKNLVIVGILFIFVIIISIITYFLMSDNSERRNRNTSRELSTILASKKDKIKVINENNSSKTRDYVAYLPEFPKVPSEEYLENLSWDNVRWNLWELPKNVKVRDFILWNDELLFLSQDGKQMFMGNSNSKEEGWSPYNDVVKFKNVIYINVELDQIEMGDGLIWGKYKNKLYYLPNEVMDEISKRQCVTRVEFSLVEDNVDFMSVSESIIYLKRESEGFSCKQKESGSPELELEDFFENENKGKLYNSSGSHFSEQKTIHEGMFDPTGNYYFPHPQKIGNRRGRWSVTFGPLYLYRS